MPSAETLLLLSTVVAALGCGLMAGLFFAFSVCVMRALARLPSADGMAAMRMINSAIINPTFGLVFFGTAAACVVVTVASAWSWSHPGVGYSLLGGTIYLLGSFSVTFAVNVPKNNALASVVPSVPEAAGLWADYLSKWTAWNHLRTVSSFASAVLMAIAGVQPSLQS